MFSHIPLKDNSIPLGELQMSAPDLAALTAWSSTVTYTVCLSKKLSFLYYFNSLSVR